MKRALRDSRLSEERYRRELARMAREAGWAEIGGRLIREDSNDCKSPVIGRTAWVPYAEWFQRLQQDDGARVTGGQQAVERAVTLALRGWRMTTRERRTVTWMLCEIEGFFAEWAEQEAQAASF